MNKNLLNINENGFKVINSVLVKYTGEEENVAIPKGVTEIGDSAFKWCESLKSVTIPNGVTIIGDLAFFYCSSLTNVIIPDSVTTIGEHVFDGCDDLETIVVPNSVVNIAKHAFDTFDMDAFSEERTSICEFYEDWNPDECQKKIDAMSEEDYMYCNIIIRVNPDSYVVQYAKDNHIRYTVDGSLVMEDNTLAECIGARGDIVIPDGVTSIGDYVFCFHSNLTSVTIPNSVMSIEKSAFECCKDLIIKAYPNSYAAQYAKENNIKLEII